MHRVARTATVGTLVTLVGAASLALAPTAAPQTTGTETFEFTGAAQSFTVPAGVTSITVQAFGAQGGAGGECSQTSICDGQAGAGGLGAFVTTTVAVTPGETLTVRVGGAGVDGTDVIGGAGGFGGGGSGGASSDQRPGNNASGSGGGGGGASAVLRGTAFLVGAAGGGGGGGGGGRW